MNKVYRTTFSFFVVYDLVFLSLALMPRERDKYLTPIRIPFVLIKLISYVLSAIFSHKVIYLKFGNTLICKPVMLAKYLTLGCCNANSSLQKSRKAWNASKICYFVIPLKK